MAVIGLIIVVFAFLLAFTGFAWDVASLIGGDVISGPARADKWPAIEFLLGVPLGGLFVVVGYFIGRDSPFREGRRPEGSFNARPPF